MDSPDDSPKTRPLKFKMVKPDHYNAYTKSPSPTDADKRPFPFMSLPVEVRLQVYRIYLADKYTPAPEEIHEMVLDSHHRTKSSPEILRVSKTMNAEVRDLLQQEETMTLRICGQDATLDGFAMSCLQSRGTRLDYDHVTHLRVEIYPRHIDRPTDMVNIWRYVDSLCYDLKEASCVQELSIHFMENKYAAWSIKGGPFETFATLQFMLTEWARWDEWGEDAPFPENTGFWDIFNVLALFRVIENVKKAQIHLPPSVTENKELQKARKVTEENMTRTTSRTTTSLDVRRQAVRMIAMMIADKEDFFKFVTGSRALERLDKLCGRHSLMLRHDFELFEKVWPHMDIGDRAWRERSDYIGYEGMKEEVIE